MFLPSAHGALEWRDNVVEGEFSNLGNFGRVSGNSQSSFVDERVNYASEMNLRLSREKMPFPGQWAFDGETTVRKTDDRQIDRRHDLHLLYLNLHAHNSRWDINFGDFFAQLTPLTLNRSLKGGQLIYSNEDTGTRWVSSAGRALLAEEEIQNSRYVLGQRLEQRLLRDFFPVHQQNPLIKTMTAGANWVDTFDSPGSTQRDTGVQALRNGVGGFDAATEMLGGLKNRTELARSQMVDEDGVRNQGAVWGNALKIENDYSKNYFLGYSRFSLDYENITPNFSADSGSAALDREAVYTDWYHRFTRRLNLDFAYREFHDNLQDFLATTLRVYNPALTVNLMPFSSNFEWLSKVNLRFRYDVRKNRASDRGVDNNTHDLDFNLSNRYKAVFAEGRYNFRRIDDQASTSDQSGRQAGFRTGLYWNHRCFNFSPYVDYNQRHEQTFDPQLRDSNRNLNLGSSLTLLRRFRLNASSTFIDIDRQLVNQDNGFRAWNVSAEYDLSEHFLLAARFDRRKSRFEQRNLDFAENIGEVRLVYKI